MKVPGGRVEPLAGPPDLPALHLHDGGIGPPDSLRGMDMGKQSNEPEWGWIFAIWLGAVFLFSAGLTLTLRAWGLIK